MAYKEPPVTAHPLCEEDRNMAREVAWALFGAFSWADTPQGGDYWDEVHENLLELSK